MSKPREGESRKEMTSLAHSSYQAVPTHAEACDFQEPLVKRAWPSVRVTAGSRNNMVIVVSNISSTKKRNNLAGNQSISCQQFKCTYT